MKKILALVVAFALCFTAIGGCLTTFAADAAADAALAVNAPGDLVSYNSAEIAVVVSGTGYTAYAAQELKVTFPDALTLKSIDGIDEFDAVGQANYKVATADGVTTVTLVQETPGDTFELTFNLALAAANQSGYIKTYTVAASAEVGTDVDNPVLYTVAEASDYFNVDCSHGAVKLAFDATGHWYECPCYVDSCEVRTETEEHTFGEDNICTVCNYAKVEEPEVCEHVAGDPVEENRVEATPGVAGSYDSVVYCTLCNEELSRTPVEIPALPVEPTCDHANKTYTDNGDGTHTIGCEDCDYSVVATLDQSLSTALSPTKISVGNKFGFYYSLSLRYVEHDYFEFVSSKPELNTTTFHYTGNVLPKVFKAEDATASYPTVHRYYFTYAEVALYEMSVPVTATVYVTKGDEVKYYTFAPMTLAQLGADKYNDSSSAATLKSLMADMLNLGTEAQLYFGNYKGTTGNALLACEKMPNELTTLDEQYFTDYEGKLNVIDATADVEFSATRLLIDAAPSLYFNWKEGSCTNPADLTFKATYYSIAQGKNMVRECNGADLMDSEKQYGERIGRYYFNFTSIDLYDADKTITYTITHKDGRVWTCVTSVETLLSTTVNTVGDTQKLHQATAAFAVATHNHWPNY